MLTRSFWVFENVDWKPASGANKVPPKSSKKADESKFREAGLQKETVIASVERAVAIEEFFSYLVLSCLSRISASGARH